MKQGQIKAGFMKRVLTYTMVFVTAYVMLQMFYRFDLVASGEHIYKSDRLTGQVWEYIQSGSSGSRWIRL